MDFVAFNLQINENKKDPYNLNVLIFDRYIFFVKSMCGNECEMILEEVLMNGYITASEAIAKTYKKIEQSPCM